MRREVHVACMEERTVVFVVLVGEHEGNIPSRRLDDNIKLILRKCVGRAWTGLSWLRRGTGRGHVWKRYGTFGFHKIRGISCLAENW